MGCDIHVCCEYKNRYDKWVTAEHFIKEGQEYKVLAVYRERHYALFSALAGVRRYSNDVEPVSEPKGMPVDCTPETMEMYKDWDLDAHSASWLTLEELYRWADANKIVKRSGLLNEAQRQELKKGILPRAWCQGTNQPGFERCEWEEPYNVMEDLIKALETRAIEVFSLWSNETPISKEHASRFRIVFWFDN